MPSLDSILRFADLILRFRAVERGVLVKGEERKENDGEHSYSLAMLAWYINETYKLGLDQEKVFKYALAHDLVEIYAGDIYFYQQDEATSKAKHAAEEEAAKRIAEEFPEFPDLHKFIEGYEKREEREAKFIYALDKVEPVLSITLDNGRTWQRDKVTLEMLTSMKRSKVAFDPDVAKIFNDLAVKLEAEQPRLFDIK